MRAPLMNLFTIENHLQILNDEPCNVKAAKRYNKLLNLVPERDKQGNTLDVKVTRQNVKYWRLIHITHGGSKAKAVKELKSERALKAPEPRGQGGSFDKKRVYGCILAIPDQHAPYQHPDALKFLIAVREAFNPDLVVNLGDELDFHAMSFHDSDPNLDSAGPELERGKKWLHKLEAEFPNQLICDSNHGSMTFRRAKAHGLPVQLIRGYREVIFPDGNGQGWHWAENWRVRTPMGEVMFKHQSVGGILADAAHNACNLLVGHEHGKFSIEYTASSSHLYWGGFSGCLIDKDSYAFAYGKNFPRKPIIGCTVILQGRPMLIPMVLNKKGRWVGSL